MEVLAGSGLYGFADGAGIAAQFHDPQGIAVDGEENILVADKSNHRVRRIAPCGAVSTVAGGRQGYADGASGAARFNGPRDVAVDGEGNIFVLDTWNRRVRKITPNGIVSTLAGSGSKGCADGVGTAAQFNFLVGIAVDGQGGIIVTDSHNHNVRKIAPDGTVSTVAGSGIEGYADGPGASAQFRFPEGVAVDGEGNIFIVDWRNSLVRKIAPDGTVSTVAGSGIEGYADGAGASAQFRFPYGAYGVAVDGEGNVIVSDSNQVRKITPDGTVSTCFAGSCENFLKGREEHCESFRGVAIDAHGCVVVIRNIVKGNCSHPAVAKIMGCSLAPPRAAEQKRSLAFCMLSHVRLGRDSIWAGLKQELLQMVLGKY